tara:strand:- start:650 stop:871 length:222 start_codon:yes stop_codon:yes gene_type:complete
MDLTEKHIARLKNDQKRLDKAIDINKSKFIDEIKAGLGKQIIEDISEKEIIEEPQTKGLFRKMTEWILSLSAK